jgi:hypothetical protein
MSNSATDARSRESTPVSARPPVPLDAVGIPVPPVPVPPAETPIGIVVVVVPLGSVVVVVPGTVVVVAGTVVNVVVVAGTVVDVVVVAGRLVDVVVVLVVVVVPGFVVVVVPGSVVDVVDVVVDVVVVVPPPAKVSGAVNHDWPPVIWNCTTMSHWCVESQVSVCVVLKMSVHAAPVPMPTWKSPRMLADVSDGATATNFWTSAAGDTLLGEQNGPSRSKSAVLLIPALCAHRCTRISDTLPAANVALTATA